MKKCLYLLFFSVSANADTRIRSSSGWIIHNDPIGNLLTIGGVCLYIYYVWGLNLLFNGTLVHILHLKRPNPPYKFFSEENRVAMPICMVGAFLGLLCAIYLYTRDELNMALLGIMLVWPLVVFVCRYWESKK